MSPATNDRRYSELLALTESHCNGNLSGDEFARLEQLLLRDFEARALFRRYLALDAALRDYGGSAAAQWVAGPPAVKALSDAPGAASRSAEAAAEQAHVIHRHVPSRLTLIARLRSLRAGIRLAGAAALAIGIGAILFVFFAREPADAAHFGSLGQVTGDVRILAADGHVRAIAGDVPIMPGDTVRTRGTQSSAVVTYPGARLMLVGDTSVTCGDSRSRSMVVHQGTLAAFVEPRATETPLLLATPSAQVHVLGTRFLIEAAAHQTDLSVTEGLVRLVRISDGQAVEVSPGKHAALTEHNNLLVQDIPRLATTWEADFEQRLPEEWLSGERITEGLPPGSRGAVESVRYKSDDGQAYYGIRSNEAWLQGLFAVQKDSHLHFTFKLERPGWINVFLVTRTSGLTEPRFSGNYLFNEFPKITPGQWQTISIPLARFQRLHSGTQALERLTPFKLMFVCDAPDRGLTIDRIWVTSDGPGEVELNPIQ